jgi:hypothetical protein
MITRKKPILKLIKYPLFHIFLWGTAITFALIGPKLVTHIFQEEGQPTKVNIDIQKPADRKSYRHSIGQLSIFDESMNIYKINGWAFSMLTPAEPTDNYDTYFILFNESKNYLFKTRLHIRKDVVQHFEDLNIKLRNPGFDVLINHHFLESGRYCIALQLTHKENGNTQVIATERVVMSTPNKLILLDEKDNNCLNQIHK